jgi:hypothetical protein
MYYELHLTATPQPYSALPRFQTTCADLGGKAVLIELPEGEHPQQPMFSAVIQSDDYHAVRQHIQMLANRFAAQGFTIVREKIEIPADCAVCFQTSYPNEKPCYFEWHGKVRHKTEELPTLRAYCSCCHAHLSRNTLRHTPDQRFITVRHSGNYTEFVGRVQKLLDDLPDSVSLIKQQFEYCVYDGNLDLDKGWTH